jgi:hypothetical protein
MCFVIDECQITTASSDACTNLHLLWEQIGSIFSKKRVSGSFDPLQLKPCPHIVEVTFADGESSIDLHSVEIDVPSAVAPTSTS